MKGGPNSTVCGLLEMFGAQALSPLDEMERYAPPAEFKNLAGKN